MRIAEQKSQFRLYDSRYILMFYKIPAALVESFQFYYFWFSSSLEVPDSKCIGLSDSRFLPSLIALPDMQLLLKLYHLVIAYDLD
jgi:hypothetical protein